MKDQFRGQREETLQEIERLQDALKVLQEEEARKVAELEQEVVKSNSGSIRPNVSNFRSCSLAAS